MQYPQTRYQDTLATGINNSQLTLAAELTPPTRTQGILTIGRLQANTEDVLFTSVSGNTVTISLRGLSQTALTPTTVAGNQLVHNQGESLEITTHHNYDTDLLRKTENDTVTGLVTFQNGLLTPSLQDINGNVTISTPATANAVNSITITNAPTGTAPTLSASGTDSNINLSITGKGTGVPILENGSQTATSAAPTSAAQLANKAYVDAQVAGISTKPTALYAPTDQIVADTVTSGDITSNQNLLYFFNGTGGDNKWHKVTATMSTWYYQLGLCLTPITGGSTGAQILLQGEYTLGTAFGNINPTFTSTLTGSSAVVGDGTSGNLAAFLIDNSAGAEAIITGGTVSASQTGTPAGPLSVSLVLQAADQSQPACFFDATNNLPRGAIIASTTIPQASFSGTFTSLPFSFGTTKIPANCQVYLVFSLQGTQSTSNFYLVQTSTTTASVSSSTPSTWSGTANAGFASLTVVSTSPIGYGVKTLTSGVNGSYGLQGNTVNSAWNRVIGYVTSTTTIIFNPNPQLPTFGQGSKSLTITSGNGLDTITFNFCPTSVQVDLSGSNVATTTKNGLMKGNIRGDNLQNRLNPASNGVSYIFPGSAGTVPSALNSNGFQSNQPTQNLFHIARLESGCYVYIGYPSGANFLSAGATSFTTFNYSYSLLAT